MACARFSAEAVVIPQSEHGRGGCCETQCECNEAQQQGDEVQQASLLRSIWRRCEPPLRSSVAAAPPSFLLPDQATAANVAIEDYSTAITVQDGDGVMVLGGYSCGWQLTADGNAAQVLALGKGFAGFGDFVACLQVVGCVCDTACVCHSVLGIFGMRPRNASTTMGARQHCSSLTVQYEFLQVGALLNNLHDGAQSLSSKSVGWWPSGGGGGGGWWGSKQQCAVPSVTMWVSSFIALLARSSVAPTAQIKNTQFGVGVRKVGQTGRPALPYARCCAKMRAAQSSTVNGTAVHVSSTFCGQHHT